MKNFFKSFKYGKKGFTLIELLVVVAILGVLAAVAVPNVGKFIGKGKTEAAEVELHNVQTAVMAMLADSDTGYIGATTGTAPNETGTAVVATIDMSDVTAEKASGLLYLDDYMTGLNGSSVKGTKQYAFAIDGTVTQSDIP